MPGEAKSGSTTITFPVAELEDLIVVASPALPNLPPAFVAFLRQSAGELFEPYLFARSDRQMAIIGRGLSEAELAWVEATIASAVSA